MTQKLSSILDGISRKHESLFRRKNLFTQDLSDWNTRSLELCSEFKDLETNNEKERWLKDFFNEVFDVLNRQQLPSNVSMPQISKLIEDIATGGSRDITNQELGSMMGKMFVSVSHQYPFMDDNKLVALARITKCLHKEIFKYSRISTKLFNHEQTVLLKHLLKKTKYELRKFNLLVECSAGYSQLIMLLVIAYNDVDKLQKVSYYVKQIYHLCGKYSLDSMRVLDVILQISSNFITDEYVFLIELLRNSDYWPSRNSADNNRYEYLNKGGNMMASEVISFNLSRDRTFADTKYVDMVCVLIKYGFVNFLSIWGNFGPDDDLLKTLFTDFENHLEEESMKGSSNPLAMASALTSGDDDDIGIKNNERDVNTQSLGDGRTVTQEEEEHKNQDQNPQNTVFNIGKCNFLERLLVHGCLVPALYVLRLWPKFVLLESNIPVFVARLFNHVLEPLYRNMVISQDGVLTNALLNTRLENGLISHKARLLEEIKTNDPLATFELCTRPVFYFAEWSENLETIHSIDCLFEKSHEILSILGTYLARDTKLITKICRIGIADIKREPITVDKWIDYTRKFIFPVIPSLGINPAVASEIYELMKLFPFEKRYFLYNEMLTKLSQDLLPIKFAFNKTEREAKSILKSLSVDNIEQGSRKLAKLASTNPMAVLIPAVKQIENYDKVSELVVFSARYFNEFAYDVLQYVLLLRLTNGKPAVQSDGVNQAMWVQRLSIFIADLAKNCKRMDINNIIAYIVKTLHQGNTIAISLMKELITKVGGVRDLNEVNIKQLKMLNSGEPLKKVARKLIFDSRDENNDLAINLSELFAEQNCVSEVILLLYRLNLQANSQESHYKILSSRCDEMNTLLWSFIELVKYSFKGDNFVKYVLPFDVLNNEYHVSTPWVFHIWRDYLEESGENQDTFAIQMLKNAVFNEVDFTSISKNLFITFWKLSLYDIQFDKLLYEENKISLEEDKAIVSSTRKKNELTNKIKEVLGSCLLHQKTYNQTLKLFDENTTSWRDSLLETGILPFFQHCIVPRTIFSPTDALYSAYFIKHFEVPYVLQFFGEFVRSNVLGTLLFCCTRLEAGNLGIFYMELLGDLQEMRINDKIDMSQRRELYDLHLIITEQVIGTICNQNYMSIRNGIEFMKHLSSVFPVIDSHIGLVCVALEHNLVGEQREDIKLPSNALLGHLKARLKNSMRINNYCELNESEKEHQSKHESELEEIRQYEVHLSNEKKQAELRKKLEQNKKQREASERERQEKTVNEETNSPSPAIIPRGPSGDKANFNTEDVSLDSSRAYKLLNRVCFDIRNDRIDKVLSSLQNNPEAFQIKELLMVHMPIQDLRNSVYEILEKFFQKNSHSKDEDMTKHLITLKNAIENLTRDGIKRYKDDSTERAMPESKKTSRYNSTKSNYSSTSEMKGKPLGSKNEIGGKYSNVVDRPYSSRSTYRDANKAGTTSRFSTSMKSVSEKRENSPDEQKRKSFYSNRQHRTSHQDRSGETVHKYSAAYGPEKKETPIPSAPRVLLFPERPSNKGEPKTNDRKPLSSSSYAQGSQGSKTRRTHGASVDTEERPVKRFRPDDKRYGSSKQNERFSGESYKEARDRSRYNKDSRNQSLPQGPKTSGEPGSRYQR